jgi:hypothetical protein
VNKEALAHLGLLRQKQTKIILVSSVLWPVIKSILCALQLKNKLKQEMELTSKSVFPNRQKKVF